VNPVVAILVACLALVVGLGIGWFLGSRTGVGFKAERDRLDARSREAETARAAAEERAKTAGLLRTTLDEVTRERDAAQRALAALAHADRRSARSTEDGHSPPHRGLPAVEPEDVDAPVLAGLDEGARIGVVGGRVKPREALEDRPRGRPVRHWARPPWSARTGAAAPFRYASASKTCPIDGAPYRCSNPTGTKERVAPVALEA